MSQNEFSEKVEELKSLLSFRSEIDEQINELETIIKSHMEASGEEEQRIGLFTVRWKQITSNRFDANRFKSDFPDVYDEYLITKTCRRFSVA